MAVAVKVSLDQRVRTDVRMSARVLRILGEQGRVLGIPKNAMFTIGACFLAARLTPLLSGVKKRGVMLDKIEALFEETLESARKVT